MFLVGDVDSPPSNWTCPLLRADIQEEASLETVVGCEQNDRSVIHRPAGGR